MACLFAFFTSLLNKRKALHIIKKIYQWRYSALIIQAKWIIIEKIFFFLVVRAIFKWKSRVILDCIGFPLLCFVVGPENFYQPLNQSGMKFKKPGNPELMVSLVLCFQEGCLFLFKVLLALCDISICSHWLL